MLPRFMVIADPDAGPEEDFAAKVEAAVANGADAVQLRAPGASARDMFRWASALEEVTRRHGAALIINDRIDVAMAVGARGVHLPQHGLPPKGARAVAGRMIMGVSVHSPEEIEGALDGGADYLLFGHVFPTGSKRGIPPRGLDKLSEAAAMARARGKPVLALGGINAGRLAAVRKAGAEGFAVLSGIMGAPGAREAGERATRLMASWQKALLMTT